jgi:hypothetical protein
MSFYGLPGLIGLIVIALRGEVEAIWPRDQERILIVAVAVGTLILLLFLIVIGGLSYFMRQGAPLFGLWLLDLVAVLRFSPEGLHEFAVVVLICWIVILAGSLVYSQVALNSILREPSPVAADTLRTLWDRQFSCGPGYIIGNDRPARGIAIYFKRPARAIAFDEMDRAGWFDRERMQRFGAIFVEAPDPGQSPVWLPSMAGSAALEFSLPFRRTLSPKKQDYFYYFSPPRGC